jgi:hypothetical protein
MALFSDLLNGPEMLREAFGHRVGMTIWRVVLLAVAIGIVAVAATQVTGFTQLVFAVPHGPVSVSPIPPLQPPVKTQKCVITGGTNNGTQIQNCSN